MEAREYERSYALEEEHWWFRSKRAMVLALLRRYGRLGGRGLDVGCGTGGMLQALAGKGAWVGVDAEPLALALSGKRGLGRLVAGSATALPFRDQAFDACLCLDLLYHRAVVSDALALAECHRVLRAGGVLVVSDSALAWLRSPHDEAVHGARRYTRRELVARVRAAGFTPLLASYAYCLVFPAVAAVRLARRAGPPPRRERGPAGRRPRDQMNDAPRPDERRGRGSDVFRLPRPINGALLAVQAVERALLRLFPLPFGSSVICVARKDTT